MTIGRALLFVLLLAMAALGAYGLREKPIATEDVDAGPGRMLPAWIDFGPLDAVVPGAWTCPAEKRDPAFAWARGMVRNRIRTFEPDVAADFVEGRDATFLVAVEPPGGEYQVEVVLGDATESRGPVTLEVNGRVVDRGIVTAAGEERPVRFRARANGGLLAIRLRTDECGGFAALRVHLRGPIGARLGSLAPAQAPVDPVPPAGQLRPIDPGKGRKLLATMCDFLLATAPREGGFSYHGAWYQNAFPVRALLAADRILKRPDYREAAFAVLDEFARRQRADGNWYSGYVTSPGCEEAAGGDSASANLADIGTMTTCLALAAPGVDPARRANYLEAAGRYADAISLPEQFPDGSFPDGRWAGNDLRHPYTVATATQAASLAALFDATGDPRYREAAERAARWLTANTVRGDGMVCLHPHNRPEAVMVESTDFGDMFYVADGLTLVRGVTTDDSLRKAIDATIDTWLFALHGARSRAEEGYWWLPRDPWTNSKIAGMLYILETRAAGDDDPAGAWPSQALAWMADPSLRSQYGIMREPWVAGGEFALPATGFAALGVAAAIERGTEFASRE